MVINRGDMWSRFRETDYFLITTNPIVRKDGANVMGAGIAKQFAERYPKGPYDFGREILAHQDRGLHMDCGAINHYDDQFVGYFMVKDHWREPAKLRIIRDSARKLRDWASNYPSLRFDLNFPGIGNGKLRREDVLPMLEDLPDNVNIWEYE